MIKKTCFYFLFIAYFCFGKDTVSICNAQTSAAEIAWVDSVFQQMTFDEQLGQLMMIRAHSDKGANHIAAVERLIKNYHIGGLCFFQGTPEKQVELTNRYQKLTKRIPLIVAMDAEWGLGMRFKEDGMSFPQQLMLGAIQNNRLIYDMGKEVARQLRRIGVHINFAPVADVNNNPLNPVINTRSFGEDRYNVAAKSYMYMRGLQEGNVMACAKHFPGHGDTDVDSHYDLPRILHPRERLDSIELLPFRVLAREGIQSMMIAHLHVPAIDPTPNLPTTLSSLAIDSLLKKEMHYDGLIFTDGLGMKGVTKYYQPGEVEAKALQAGNDVLLLPEDVEAAFKSIKKYIAEGKLDTNKIATSVKKILRAKYRLGIKQFTPIDTQNIRAELETPHAKALRRQLIQNALTLVRNQNDLLPFREIEDFSAASIAIGASGITDFQKHIEKFVTIPHFHIGKNSSTQAQKALLQKVADKKNVLISLHNMSNYASKNYGLTDHTIALVKKIAEKHQVILTVFGSPYSIAPFDDIPNLLVAYTEQIETQELAAQALFGAIGMSGKLPVTASPQSKCRQGVRTAGIYRMGYALPEAVGFRSAYLNKIDTLMEEAIKTEATPGGVVLVAKNGKIVFEKAYGYHTYQQKRAVQTDDIYDLASITKIAAATLAVMKLHEERRIHIDRPMSAYLPALKGTNKEKITIREILTHRARLQPWIKFYKNTLTETGKGPYPSTRFYKKEATTGFAIPVAENLFLQVSYPDSIRQAIYDSDLRKSKAYKYSDLGFYLLADMVNAVTGKTLDVYMRSTFYQPMGLRTMGFNPLRQFSKDRIPPTERDQYFRRQTIHGYVHDMGSAMMGGVSGHAGLFSNAQDLAVLMQMLLNGGNYAGRAYLQPETIQMFTQRCKDCPRRGLGFDMSQLDRNAIANMSYRASDSTFGHLGFTGTCVWADPEHQLIYIMLTNRTYPSMYNYKFGKKNYRPRVQTIAYEALLPPSIILKSKK